MECRTHVANKTPTVSRGWGLDRAGGERLFAGGLGGIGPSDGSGARKSEIKRKMVHWLCARPALG